MVKIISSDHWRNIMRKLKREKGMSTDQAFDWMSQRFRVKEQEDLNNYE